MRQLALTIGQVFHCFGGRPESPTWCETDEWPASTGPSCTAASGEEATGHNSPSTIRAMFSLAEWPNETIGHIFLAVVTARKGLPGARFAKRQMGSLGGVWFGLLVFDFDFDFAGSVVRGSFPVYPWCRCAFLDPYAWTDLLFAVFVVEGRIMVVRFRVRGHSEST
jgi:hypothetical protein